MSKKSKRQVRKNVSSAKPSPSVSSPSSRLFEFNPDYSHVTKDLRRIGTLAGIFITLLVVLSFFLR